LEKPASVGRFLKMDKIELSDGGLIITILNYFFQNINVNCQKNEIMLKYLTFSIFICLLTIVL